MQSGLFLYIGFQNLLNVIHDFQDNLLPENSKFMAQL